MDIQEIKQKKQERNGKIAGLLDKFDDKTCVWVSEVGFLRRSSYY